MINGLSLSVEAEIDQLGIDVPTPIRRNNSDKMKRGNR
jgi:hypothetical protein